MDSRRAFTLIELLVVIAIIAVLAGILFPVFASARKHSHTARCAANLRQLVQANLMYAGDTGRYVPAAQDLYETNRRRWFGVRGSDGRFIPRDGPLVPYLEDGGLLRQCPLFSTKIGFSLGAGGYVYNHIAAGSNVWDMGFVPEAYHTSRREGSVARPAQVAMFADGALDVGSSQGLAEYTFLEPPEEVLRRMGSPYSMDPSLHFRHSGRVLVGYADGHVGAGRLARTVERSGVYPRANPAAHSLGWIAPLDGETPYDPL